MALDDAQRWSAGEAAPVARGEAEVPWKQLADDQGMLLDLDSGEYYEIRGVGPAIWRRLDGRPFAELRSWLAEAYGESPERVTRDLESFLGDLAERGLIAAGIAQRDAQPEEAPADAGHAVYEPPSLVSKGNLKFLGQFD